ncbi:MAG TPA: divalent metal cation transporter, partial [Chitinophagaceae bacterium]|nr:divalent metal cation transporter [Chitinophagaceae bacterium]
MVFQTEKLADRVKRKNSPKSAYSWKSWLQSLGPGIIIAALIFGPSKITITTMLGATYDYALLWIVAVAVFFMIVFTSMSARIGIATEKSLLTAISEKWGRAAGIAAGLGIFLVTAAFQAGNSVGIGISIGGATHTSQIWWILLFNGIAIGLLFFRA